MGTLVYGTYEEIEDWCEKNDMWVDKYLDHVNPSTIYNTAEWVGTGISDPFSVSVPFDYRECRTMGTFNTRGVNLDKMELIGIFILVIPFVIGYLVGKQSYK